MKSKKSEAPKKKPDPDRQLPITTPADKAVTKAAARRPARKKAVKAPARSTPAYPEKDNQALLSELSILRERLVTQHEELQKARMELEASRDKYRHLYNTTPVAYLTLDSSASVFMANAAGSELFGAGKRGLAGSAFSRLVEPGSQDKFSTALGKMHDTGEKQSCEIDMVRLDGSIFSAYVEIAGIPDTGGTAGSILVIAVDITARKRAEETLRDSEERYKLLFENINESIYIVDRDFNITPVTPHLGKLLGFSTEESQGRNLKELSSLLPVSLDLAISSIRRVLAGETIPSTEYRIAARDGTYRYQDISASPLVKDGKVVAAICIARDITERKKVEQTLRENEERYRLLLENTSDGIYMVDRDFNVTPISRNMGKMLGYTAEEMAGTKITTASFISPESRQSAISNMLRVLAGETVRTAEYQFIGKDGKYYYQDISGAPLVRDGRVVAAICIARDITERKKTELALQKSEEKYRTLLENTGEGIAVVQDSSFQFVNTSFLALTGYDASEISGRTFTELIFPEDRDLVVKSYLERLKGEQFERTYSFRYIHKSGGIRWANINATGIEWEGKPATLNFLADITERKEAEQALQTETDWANRLLEIAGVMIVVLDTEAKVILVNPKACEILECSCEDIKGKDWISTFVPERIRDDVRADHKMVISKGGGIQYYENPVLTATGQEKIIEWQNAVMRDENGRITGTLSSGKEITLRKKAEAKLAESEEKYRTLVENAAEGIAVIQDGHLKYVNLKLVQSSGYTVEELMSKDFIDLVHPEDRELVINNALRKLSGDQSENRYTFRVIHKQGKTLWLETNSVLIDWQGSPATLNFLTDVTDRQEAEDKLLTTAIFLNNMVDQSPTATWISDPGGTMIRANKACCEMFRANEEDMVGYYNVFKDGLVEKQGLMPAVRKVYEKGEVARFEIFLDRFIIKQQPKDNIPLLILDTTVFPIRDAGGGVTNVAFQMIDLTSRKKAEASLEESNKTLKKILGDAVNTMAKIVEIRDPYTAGHQRRVAMLSTEMAGELGLDKDAIENLHMAALIHDIGKIYVPAEILSKPGKLSDIEYGIIKIHSEKGYEIVKSMDLPCVIAQAVLQHHERLDGSGYPDGLKGNDINIEGRILAVADVVEAMASHRPYRPARGLDSALQEIKQNKGILFDTAAVNACVKLFTEKGFKFEE